ncbi:hypothetical protein HDU98_002390 [Podochytrium sp. JEL0797]|nr:hypothetical protein HDU98_002390 [Podochytrium sp. JEL0797]
MYATVSLHASLLNWVWGFAALNTLVIKNYVIEGASTSGGRRRRDGEGGGGWEGQLFGPGPVELPGGLDDGGGIPFVSVPPVSPDTTIGSGTMDLGSSTGYTPSPTLGFALGQLYVIPVVWLLFVVYVYAKIVRGKYTRSGHGILGFHVIAFGVLKRLFCGMLVFGESAGGGYGRRGRRGAVIGIAREEETGGLSAEALGCTKVYAFCGVSGVEDGMEMGEVRQVVVEGGQQQEQQQRGFISSTTCSICISDYEEGEVLRELPCGHAFHEGCVDEWLMDSVEYGFLVAGTEQPPLENALENVVVTVREGHRKCPICQRRVA